MAGSVRGGEGPGLAKAKPADHSIAAQSGSQRRSGRRGREKGTRIHRIFVYGSMITKISASERPFNLEGLAERLERVFPNMVRLYSDAGIIVVMDKIRVDENGIVEGSGPGADRVRDIYERFISETA